MSATSSLVATFGARVMPGAGYCWDGNCRGGYDWDGARTLAGAQKAANSKFHCLSSSLSIFCTARVVLWALCMGGPTIEK